MSDLAGTASFGSSMADGAEAAEAVMESADTEVDAELSVAERAELTRYEKVIERNLTGFLEAGRALLAIRDGKLYRSTHGTFEDYCSERWDISRSYGYRMIGAAEVIENLSPIGDILPANESQVRPLASLEPEQQREVWTKAIESADGGKVTAAHVEKAKAEFAPQPARQHRPEPVQHTPIWELERHAREWLQHQQRQGADTGLILDHLAAWSGVNQDGQPGSWRYEVQSWLEAANVRYRSTDLKQAINNIRDQHRQQERIANSKAVYIQPVEEAESATEAEPEPTEKPVDAECLPGITAAHADRHR